MRGWEGRVRRSRLASLALVLTLLAVPVALPTPADAVTVNIRIGTNISGGRSITCSEGARRLRSRGFRDVRAVDCRGTFYLPRLARPRPVRNCRAPERWPHCGCSPCWPAAVAAIEVEDRTYGALRGRYVQKAADCGSSPGRFGHAQSPKASRGVFCAMWRHDRCFAPGNHLTLTYRACLAERVCPAKRLVTEPWKKEGEEIEYLTQVRCLGFVRQVPGDGRCRCKAPAGWTSRGGSRQGNDALLARRTTSGISAQYCSLLMRFKGRKPANE